MRRTKRRTWRRQRKTENEVERKMTMAMIVSTSFLRDIEKIYKPELLESDFIRTITQWCMRHYTKYKEAPGRHIEDLLHSRHRKGQLDDDKAELIGQFLSGLSKDYERGNKLNTKYLLDLALTHFKERSLQAFKEDLGEELESGNVAEAEALVGRYTRIDHTMVAGFNPSTDEEAVRRAFEQSATPLFTLPGAYGWLLNSQLCRGGFVSLMGPEKSGKTFQLMHLTQMACRARCNVAFFGAGDMSADEYTVRWHVSLAKRSNEPEYCGPLLIPVLDCAHNQDNTCRRRARLSEVGVLTDSDDEGHPTLASFKDADPDYVPCAVCAKRRTSSRARRSYKGAVWYKRRGKVNPLTWQEGMDYGERFVERLSGCDLKWVAHGSDEVSVKDINTQLDVWQDYDGFMPDVVVIDYADILGPEPGMSGKDERTIQNKRWMALRSLALNRNCLVITATQTDAASYEVHTLKRKHFSEDKRKYGHVTCMIGLNQTEEEQARGIQRINKILVRKGGCDPSYCIKVLQCLQIGRPHIASYF